MAMVDRLQANRASSTSVWVYLDAQSGAQRGPLTDSMMKKLFRKGILKTDQLVWKPGLSEWKPLHSVEPFDIQCVTWGLRWFFLTPDNVEQGPVTTESLLELFMDGKVDGLTVVWTDKSEASRLPLCEVQSLKQVINEMNEALEQQEEFTRQQETFSASDQVFKESAGEAFVAEDGKEYVFDQETKQFITPQDKIEEELNALQEIVASVPERDDKRSINSQPLLPDAESEEKDDTKRTISENGEEAIRELKRKRKKKSKANIRWRRSKQKTWIYVNGLPLDTTIEEVVDYFSKCGVIQKDLLNEQPRIKLYQTKDEGGLNGDAAICYMKEASVELATQLLDQSEFRPEWRIDVSPAVFQQKGDEFVAKKKVKLDARTKVKRLEQEKALSWNEGEDDEKYGLRIVVLKHLFCPQEIKDETYEKEILEDIEQELVKLGEINKITLFGHHQDGVVIVKFASSGSAAKCLEVMDGRFFAGRKIDCQYWDGEDYTHRESKSEEQNRAASFDEWLEGGSSPSDEEEESIPIQE
uniref:Uncharacterized protein AlNc14C200G8664 n=1 Tax=Albugo laibachii Nc14 TaxID=890382 RepID=F0WQJ4_9STRA|nr:conserved hypothetical protein [Albugo laibachii Nc14]CCA24162.1 conserved hypothetical protein [Albugo laibachii Nc14]|eukprot:CCA24162.1 conserved hypothetical protein [Albugo laibachii Nc14]